MRYRYSLRLDLTNAFKGQWLVTDCFTGDVVHYPGDMTVVLYDAMLKVNQQRAKLIYNGRSKMACSWVKCNEYHVIPKEPPKDITIPALRLYYNPRVNVHWLTHSGGVIPDNSQFGTLVAYKENVYRVPGWAQGVPGWVYN